MTERNSIEYKAGTLDVPHLGVTLRTIFGAAAAHHDIFRDGRKVRLTLKGVAIGFITLSDAGKRKESKND